MLLLLSLFLLVSIPLTTCQIIACDTLGVSVTIASCSPSLPAPQNGISVLPVNVTFSCKAILSFNFTELYKGVEFVNFGIGYSSIIASQYAYYGSYFPAGLYWDPTTREGNASASTVAVYGNFSIPANAIGSYYGGWSLTLAHFNEPPLIYCNYYDNLPLASALPPSVVVLNNEEIADITPPYVFSVRAEHEVYRAGDVLNTFAYLVDHSAIFLDDAWTAYSHNSSTSISCPSSSWRALTEAERLKSGLPQRNQLTNQQSTNLHHPNPRANAVPRMASLQSPVTNGWFVTECMIDKAAAPGIYNLVLLNMFDEYFNGLDGAQFWTETVFVKIV